MNRRFSLIMLFLVVAVKLMSQDIHFSQFYAQPLSLNPALTGDFVGDMRLSTIQRRQWRQLGLPLVTNGVSFEKKVRVYPDFICFGLQFINDKISAANLATNKVHLSIAYLKKSGRNTWHFGTQIGYVSRTINYSGQSFPSQYDSNSGNFDSSLSSGENDLNTGKGYLDFNLGVMWVKNFSKNYQFKLGGSMSHINAPNDGFSGQESKLPIRYSIHHTSYYIVNPNWALIPEIQLMQMGGATNFVSVLKIRKVINKVSAMYVGPGIRGVVAQNDAAIAVMGFELGNMEFGFSYDLNISTLSKQTTGKSTIEFSAVLRTPAKRYKTHIPSKKKLLCPIQPKW